jgi:hypothetical protein
MSFVMFGFWFIEAMYQVAVFRPTQMVAVGKCFDSPAEEDGIMKCDA